MCSRVDAPDTTGVPTRVFSLLVLFVVRFVRCSFCSLFVLFVVRFVPFLSSSLYLLLFFSFPSPDEVPLNGNDPSAGSPTETLLRLHLPLNVEV